MSWNFWKNNRIMVIGIPLLGGKEHPVCRKDIDEYVSLYPDINVEQELRNMRGWCLANPTRRKTRKGVRTFINSSILRLGQLSISSATIIARAIAALVKREE